MTLDECVQLHESIEVHYYVDCYAAQMVTQDGSYAVLEGRGETVAEAIADLAKQCESISSLAELRNMNPLRLS